MRKKEFLDHEFEFIAVVSRFKATMAEMLQLINTRSIGIEHRDTVAKACTKVMYAYNRVDEEEGMDQE